MNRTIPQASERRAFGRRDSCIRAVIHVAGRPPLHCIVRNFSRGGASLELSEPLGVEATLRIVIDQHGVDAMCEVRHQSGVNMGVRFLTEVEVDRLANATAAATSAGAVSSTRTGQSSKPAPKVPELVTGCALRRTLFGAPAPEEPEIIRTFSTPSGGIIRHP